jgi:hypothetical protein
MHVERQATTDVRRSLPPERATVSVRILAMLAVGALLYFGHAVFIPIALAILFALILTAPVEALHRLGLPRRRPWQRRRLMRPQPQRTSPWQCSCWIRHARS